MHCPKMIPLVLFMFETHTASSQKRDKLITKNYSENLKLAFRLES